MSVNQPLSIHIPLVNPNEVEAVLTGIHITNGQYVSEGELICTLETTKSAIDVQAEGSGYAIGLQLEEGDIVNAGDLFCYLAGDPDWKPPEQRVGQDTGSGTPARALPPNLRITQPALALAQQNEMDLAQLPTDQLVTERQINALLESQRLDSDYARVKSAFDPTAIIIYGGGGHGKALIDLVRNLGVYRIAGILDDALTTDHVIMGVPVLGTGDYLSTLYEQGVRLAINAVGGIGNIGIRVKVFHRLAEAGFVCPTLVHPSAFVETSAKLAPGVQILPHAYVGSEASVGYGAIINTGAIVSHDCQIGDYANIAPGSILAGEVTIGASALVGMGVTINLGVKIGPGARIGNSATVKQDVPNKGIVRAGTIWPAT